MFKKTIADAKALTSTTHEVTITVDPEPIVKITKAISKTYVIMMSGLVVTSMAIRIFDAKYPSPTDLEN